MNYLVGMISYGHRGTSGSSVNNVLHVLHVAHGGKCLAMVWAFLQYYHHQMRSSGFFMLFLRVRLMRILPGGPVLRMLAADADNSRYVALEVK